MTSRKVRVQVPNVVHFHWLSSENMHEMTLPETVSGKMSFISLFFVPIPEAIIRKMLDREVSRVRSRHRNLLATVLELPVTSPHERVTSAATWQAVVTRFSAALVPVWVLLWRFDFLEIGKNYWVACSQQPAAVNLEHYLKSVQNSTQKSPKFLSEVYTLSSCQKVTRQVKRPLDNTMNF